MKKLILLLLLGGALFQNLNSQKAIFVKAGSSGDGYSPISAVSSLKQAFDLCLSGDTIKVIGNVDISPTEIVELYDQSIVLMGFSGSDTVFRASDCEDDLFKLYIGSELIIKNLVLHGRGDEISNADAFVKLHDGSRLELLEGAVLCHNNGDESGTINAIDGSVWLRGGQIVDNRATQGAAALIRSNSSFHFYSGLIARNRADVYNSGINYLAGAILLRGTMYMYGGQIEYNYSENDGGAIMLFPNSNLTIYGGEIANNQALGYGGAISNYGHVEIYGGEIHNNLATHSAGIDNNGSLSMYDGLIYKNTAAKDAGGIFNYIGVCKLYGGAIYENQAAINGGGVLTGTQDGGSQTIIYDSIAIYDNTSSAPLISSNIVVVTSNEPANPNTLELGSPLTAKAHVALSIPSVYDGALVLSPSPGYTITNDDVLKMSSDQNGKLKLVNGNVVYSTPYDYTLYNQGLLIHVERAGIRFPNSPFVNSGAALRAIEVDRGITAPDCNLTFGKNGDTLDVNDTIIVLTQGNYTLYGKVKGLNSNFQTGIIDISTRDTVNSYAHIYNTSLSYDANAIYHRDKGVLNIYEGEISSNQGVTILTGNALSIEKITLNVYGGTINNHSDSIPAIQGFGNINIYGGTMYNQLGATVRYGTKNGAMLQMFGGHIINKSGKALELTTAQGGNVQVLLAGGTLETQDGCALDIRGNVNAKINITGTHLIADKGIALESNSTEANIEVSDNALLTSNNTSKATVVLMSGPLWQTVLNVKGGIIRNTASGPLARAIYNDSSWGNGYIEISGGLIEQTGTEGYGIQVGRQFARVNFTGPVSIIGGTAAIMTNKFHDGTPGFRFENNTGAVDTNSIGISVTPVDGNRTMRYHGGAGHVVKHLIVDNGYQHVKVLMTQNINNDGFLINDSLYVVNQSNVFITDKKDVLFKAKPSVGRKIQSYKDHQDPSIKLSHANEGYTAKVEAARVVEMKFVDIPTYILSFDANGGQGLMGDQVFYQDQEQEITPQTFSRTHFVFNSWNIDAGGTGQSYRDQQELTLSANLKLYAQWEDAIYKIVFINPTETGNDTLYSANAKIGDAAQYLGITPTKPSTSTHRFFFKGWFTLAEEGAIDDLVPTDGSRSVYAQFDSAVCATTETLIIDSCERAVYKGVEYTTNQDFIETLVNTEGCDSILNVQIRIRKTSNGQANLIACDSLTYNGKTYTRDTVLTELYTNSVGCDSVQTVQIQILKSSTSAKNLSACEMLSYKGITYLRDTVLTELYTNSVGCDSVQTVQIQILKSSTSAKNLSACEMLSYKGITYLRDTVLTELYTNSVGCDSVQTVQIQILKSSTSAKNLSACEMLSYKGITYLRDTVLTELYTNSVGCDSVQTVQIQILKRSISAMNLSGCEMLSYKGITYMRDTVLTEYYTNSVGCDSVQTVQIQILKSSTNTVNLTGCETLVYNAKTYTRDTVLTELYTNSVGCDSVYAVQIQILKRSISAMNLSGCEMLSYKGITYMRDTVLTEYYTNSVGCDSTVLVTIRIKKISKSVLELDSEGSVLFENVLYYSDTTLYRSYVNPDGCDSLVIISIVVREYSNDDTDLYLMIAFDKQALIVANKGSIIRLQQCQFEWTRNGEPMSDTKQYVSLINRQDGDYRVKVKIGTDRTIELDTVLSSSAFMTYPNPAKTGESVYVQGEAESTHLEVYTIQNKRIELKGQYKQADRYCIDGILPRGVYLIRVMKGVQVIETLKLIVN